jgi:transposase
MIRLADEQWERIPTHFPEEHIPDGRPGHKPIPTRHVLEAVLWILNTGAQWHMRPLIRRVLLNASVGTARARNFARADLKVDCRAIS